MSSSLSVEGREVVEDRHPQAGQGGEQAGGSENASGDPVPAAAAAERGQELERPEQAVHGDAGDVDQHGQGRVEEPRVLRRDRGAAGQLAQAQRAVDQRDEAEKDQAGRHGPLGPGTADGCAGAAVFVVMAGSFAPEVYGVHLMDPNARCTAYTCQE